MWASLLPQLIALCHPERSLPSAKRRVGGVSTVFSGASRRSLMIEYC
jgi:hypothetical protein